MSAPRDRSADGLASSPDAKRRRISPSTKISLTQTEEQVRKVLLAVVDEIAAQGFKSTAVVQKSDEPLTLRISGGWVRDKILGRESKDIDIAVNTMSGFEYTTFLTAYLEKNAGKDGIPPVRSVYKVERNPAKGKHLETATTKVFDMDIDFVNLRGTSYGEVQTGSSTEGSEGTGTVQPTEIGSPQEDAMRRDATVNALFYNLNTNEVEDFTGKGLEDLEKGILRTPLEPRETFEDDPLRAVRIIRFAANYGFTIAPEVETEISTDIIRQLVRSNVSRERIGTELDKMLSGPRPLLALSTIHRLGLYPSLFSIQTLDPSPSLNSDKSVFAGQILEHISAHLGDSALGATLREGRLMAWKAAALVPWYGVQLGKGFKKSAVANVITSGLCGSNSDVNMMEDGLRAYEEIRGTAERNFEERLGRGGLGLLVKKWGATWKHSMIVSLLSESLTTSPLSLSPTSPIHSTLIPRYEALLRSAEEMGVSKAYEKKKSLLDGKEICKVLGVKPGPWMKEAVDELIRWEFDNPEKGREEAEGYVKGEIWERFGEKMKK